jgi:hypothetical protein
MRLVAVIPFVVLVLAGCAIQPKLPPTVSSGPAFVADRKPTEMETDSSSTLPNTYFGATGASGSVAVGLLLGPLGVAANHAYIKSEHEKRSAPLGPLTSQDLGAILAASVPELSRGGADRADAYELVPAANLFFSSETRYGMACTITVRRKGPEEWSSRYSVPVDADYDTSRSTDTTDAVAALGPCLRAAHALFREHLSGSLAFQPRDVAFRTADGKSSMSLTYLVATSQLPGRVIVNDAMGVVQFRRSGVAAIK